MKDINELNKEVSLWRIERNNKAHRTTGEMPSVLFKKERLKNLPQIPYKPYRVQQASISTTGFVCFDTNRYSAPSSHSGTPCDILAYPNHIEITVKGRKIAVHPRTFEKNTKIENPSHREKLLEVTPNFKHQRIYQLMKGMDKNIEQFLAGSEQEGQDPLFVSYELFKLLKDNAKETLLSAVKEALASKIYKVAYVQSLLRPSGYQDNPVHPQNTSLLNIDYEGRNLNDYDELI